MLKSIKKPLLALAVAAAVFAAGVLLPAADNAYGEGQTVGFILGDLEESY